MPASRAKRALETVNAVIIAKREANILSRGDLQSGDGDGG
jgi:hypothetical protein